MAQDKRVELMRQRKDAVEIGDWQECSLAVCPPLGLRQGLARGTVAIAARAISVACEATLGTVFGMPTELRGTTGDEGVEHLVLSRRHPMGLPVGVAVEADDVGDFPPGPLRLRRPVFRMGTG